MLIIINEECINLDKFDTVKPVCDENNDPHLELSRAGGSFLIVGFETEKELNIAWAKIKYLVDTWYSN